MCPWSLFWESVFYGQLDNTESWACSFGVRMNLPDSTVKNRSTEIGKASCRRSFQVIMYCFGAIGQNHITTLNRNIIFYPSCQNSNNMKKSSNVQEIRQKTIFGWTGLWNSSTTSLFKLRSLGKVHACIYSFREDKRENISDTILSNR